MAECKETVAIKSEIQKICDGCWHPYRLGGCPEHCGVNDAIKAIDSVPSVDAVSVVRCKDCIYWTPHGSNGGACEFWECQGISSADFCSTGERKERDNNS